MKMQENIQTTNQKRMGGNEGGRIENVPKLMKVHNGQSYTYCGLAEQKLGEGLGHSATFYHRCMSCNKFVCYNCSSSCFRWKIPNAPICCKNVKLSGISYDKELKPKWWRVHIMPNPEFIVFISANFGKAKIWILPPLPLCIPIQHYLLHNTHHTTHNTHLQQHYISHKRWSRRLCPKLRHKKGEKKKIEKLFI